MNNNIEGKVVVITGASSGLGDAAARLLSEEGATVVLGARRADRIQALAQELSASGGKALAIATDVTRREQVKNLVDMAVETCGRVDVLLNNAGLMPLAPLERLKVDEWDQMIDVNLKGGALRYCCGVAAYEGAEVRTHHQRLFRLWPQGRPERQFIAPPNSECVLFPRRCGRR